MATQKRGSQGIGSVTGGAFALLGLTGLIGGLGHEACLLNAFFEIALRTALGVAWQLLVHCLFGHTRILEGFLQVTVGGWHLA